MQTESKDLDPCIRCDIIPPYWSSLCDMHRWWLPRDKALAEVNSYRGVKPPEKTLTPGRWEWYFNDDEDEEEYDAV